MHLLSILKVATLSLVGISSALTALGDPDVNDPLVLEHLRDRENLITLEKTHRQGQFRLYCESCIVFSQRDLLVTQIIYSDKAFLQLPSVLMRLFERFAVMRLTSTGVWPVHRTTSTKSDLQARCSLSPGHTLPTRLSGR